MYSYFGNHPHIVQVCMVDYTTGITLGHKRQHTEQKDSETDISRLGSIRQTTPPASHCTTMTHDFTGYDVHRAGKEASGEKLSK